MVEGIQPIEKLKSGVERETQEIYQEQPDYTADEITYLGGIRRRLTRARDMRDYHHDSFDGMTYIDRCRQNRLLASSYIKPRANREEVNFTTGITRQKLMVQLAYLISLNLSIEITGFDEKNIQVAELGIGIEDILEKNKELDNDEEKAMRRQYTMMEQGEVFAEVQWQKSYYLRKVIEGAIQGKFHGVKITRMLKKALDKLTTHIIRNEKVYLGDISNFDMDTQPFIFTVDVRPYEELETMFKDFEMWRYVQYSLMYLDSTTQYTEGYMPYWSISDFKKGYVEIVRYQSKPTNELQIFLNGIPMLPIGYPLSEVSPAGEYMIVKQVLAIIDEHFAYGKSLPQLLKASSALEDEFWKLAFLRGQQSFIPPYINNTGRILSSKIFMPGVLTNNIPEGKLKPLLAPNQGITQGELFILRMIRDNLDENSTPAQFAGRAGGAQQTVRQQPGQKETATSINRMQAQTEMVLGLAVFAACLLEKKITDVAIPILIKNWFDPVDQMVDKVRKGLVDIYRTANISKPIDGMGMGQEIVETQPKDKMPTGFDVFQQEKKIFEDTGVPTKKIVINRDMIVAFKYLWKTIVTPKPKKTSDLQKLMFRDKAALFIESPNFSWDWFEENAALAWNENPQKVFKRVQQGIPTQAGNVAMPGIKPNQPAGRMPVRKMAMIGQ